MKKVVMALVVVAVFAALPAIALADQPPKGLKGAVGQAGQSNVGFVELWQKDGGWQIVPGGAWGKLKYNLSGSAFEFVFNGHSLQPSTAYSLIYFADPWPGNNPGALIAGGTSDALGNIHLAGSNDLNTDLPNAKVWLVLSNDYDAANKKMTAWNPSKYLFEHSLITYDDTDV